MSDWQEMSTSFKASRNVLQATQPRGERLYFLTRDLPSPPLLARKANTKQL